MCSKKISLSRYPMPYIIFSQFTFSHAPSYAENTNLANPYTVRKRAVKLDKTPHLSLERNESFLPYLNFITKRPIVVPLSPP